MAASPQLRHRKPKKNSTPSHKSEPSKKKQPKRNGLGDNVVALILFILSLPVRLRNISEPAQVIFDEVHFGLSTSNYIKGTFFFDVHPPLAKLLISLVAWISGFDGKFDFSEIGREYTKNVPYTQMRALGAFFGAAIVPLAYLTLRNAGHSKTAASLSALAICFENGLITNNRLILLDSYMLFFTAFSVFAWTKFSNQKSFSRSWWLWLFLTGVGLGCTVSSKWVGLFTLATIGISTLKQLWELLGNVQVTKRQYFRHFFARCICLVLVPTIIYLSAFYIHFSLLTRPGPGDHFMSIETQYELKGEQPIDTPAPVTYGSLVTLRHVETSGGYLHSHLANYPEGSNQQQVTLYPFRDVNNWWRIIRVTDDESSNSTSHDDLLAKDNSTYLQYVRDGDLVMLEHVSTAPRKLHSHDVAAPVTDTDYHFEVSGYGFVDHPGDTNDFWRVIIEDESNDGRLESRRTRFRLLHTNQNCHLYSTPERLPDWGFQQQEVSCIFDGLKPKTIWTIDETQNELLPDTVEMVSEPRPGFLEKALRINKAMWTVNSELVDTHPFQSRPHAWPVLRSFVPFWLSDNTAIILLGNPFVYWVSTVSVFTFFILFGFFQLREKRGFVDSFHGLRRFYENSAGFFVLGWALHYLPFYFMDRQLFIHHYMPALYFAVLTFGVGVDLVQRKFPSAVNIVGGVTVAACIVYTFWTYAPITYGEPWTVEQCEQAQILDSWDFNCNRYAPAGSPERIELIKEEQQNTDNRLFYEYKDGGRVALEEQDIEEYEDKPVATETVDPEEIVYEEEEEYYDDDEEEDDDLPTEAPIFEEAEPDFVDGKEVFGPDDDEDEYPRTKFGYEPDDEDEEEQIPATIRQIPVTKAND